ncbi:hypothetical protein [Streptomyces sp. MJP52]|uniref:hypothetical protein n=1 Tax=Streptomyces sp. MJP52 TaxID=2940555 RepID=UPI002473FB26|nr:hypothetical protein [Streptomyces sp. MJP52]
MEVRSTAVGVSGRSPWARCAARSRAAVVAWASEGAWTGPAVPSAANRVHGLLSPGAASGSVLSPSGRRSYGTWTGAVERGTTSSSQP